MLKSKFVEIYSRLPEDIRKEIIVVIDDKPYTWDVAYMEINNDTDLGKSILKKMEELGLFEDGE